MNKANLIKEEDEKKGDDSIYFIDGYLKASTKEMNLRQNIPNEIKFIILRYSANTFVIGYGDAYYFKMDSIKIDNIVKCASFNSHSFFVDVKGSVYGIGYNKQYQLGLNHNTNVNIPQLISRWVGFGRIMHNANIIEVAVGVDHTILLCDKGYIYTMGSNQYNQCAEQYVSYIKSPKMCAYFISMTVVKISVGGNHSACITSDNNVYLFGANYKGQCGVGKETTNPKVPQKMKLSVKSVSCGYGHTLVISTNNQLYSCGMNEFGQIGNGTKKNQFGLMQVFFPHNVIDADGGGYHSLCILENGAAYSWGNGEFGQLGHGDDNNKLVPTQIKFKNIKFKKCVTGFDSSCLIDEDDNFYCFGKNENGQLCIGDKKDKYIPTKIEKKNVMDISMGNQYSFLMVG